VIQAVLVDGRVMEEAWLRVQEVLAELYPLEVTVAMAVPLFAV
jgi:hypothetical protein